MSYSARLCLPGRGRDKSGNGRTCFQRKWKRLSGWGCLVSPVCRLRFAGGLPCVGCGLSAVCPVSAVCPAPVVLPAVVACPAPVVSPAPVAVVCPVPAVSPAPAAGLPVVCPASVDWVVAVALFSVSGTAAGSDGKPPPVRKTEKNHSTKKRMFQRNIRKNEERFSENITAISVLASEILVS